MHIDEISSSAIVTSVQEEASMRIETSAQVVKGFLYPSNELSSARHHPADNIAVAVQVLCCAVHHQIISMAHRLEKCRRQQCTINHRVQRILARKRNQSIMIGNLKEGICSCLGPHEFGVWPHQTRELLLVQVGVKEVVRDAIASQVMRDKAICSTWKKSIKSRRELRTRPHHWYHKARSVQECDRQPVKERAWSWWWRPCLTQCQIRQKLELVWETWSSNYSILCSLEKGQLLMQRNMIGCIVKTQILWQIKIRIKYWC